MYCGHCPVLRAYKDSPRLRVKLAEEYGCAPGDVVCEGCQALHSRGWARDPEWGRNCRLRECLAERGLQFCHECPERLTCRPWLQLARFCEFLDVDLTENLRRIGAGQTREWLEEQDRKWRCVHCGTPFPAAEDIDLCLRCGRPARY